MGFSGCAREAPTGAVVATVRPEADATYDNGTGLPRPSRTWRCAGGESPAYDSREAHEKARQAWRRRKTAATSVLCCGHGV